ncbi:hypothetical protein PsorP6_013255 [Peronosclerospora sorghi]|uniref:Uncharacterized protein n=1 Tax=Peronosclerospora sorghi TaxID=230839 RepID=A0ACC0WGM4_9STRA|nr:hypothetical protein PsorP6_013255 [Peronosclerospora sorghi]
MRSLLSKKANGSATRTTRGSGTEGADVDPQELDRIRPDTDTKRVHYSFHVSPFNSIDHVHMRAFLDDPRRLGYYGRLKYRTESWWCRSYDHVVAKLDHLPVHEQQHEPTYNVEDSTKTFTEEGLLASVARNIFIDLVEKECTSKIVLFLPASLRTITAIF